MRVAWPRVLVIAAFVLMAGAGGGARAAEGAAELFLVGGRIYPSPTSAPVVGGTVVIAGGKIKAVIPAGKTVVRPPGAQVLDCSGATILAGFWNSHVHFSEPKWAEGAKLPAPRLGAQLDDMLLRRGFTSVVDTGSLLPNTVAIRRRVEAGEVPGPRILTAGTGLCPPGGVPFYVREALPPELLRLLPQPATPAEATRIVNNLLNQGADLIKLFVVSWVERGKTMPMSLDVIQAATAAAHARGKLVFAHPSVAQGVDLVLDGHVDVLAHTIEEPDRWTPAMVARLRAADVGLVPTLMLFSKISKLPGILDEVRSYAGAKGEILFGTDVGFLPNYDPTSEYQLLSRAGLSFPQILASLTTSPARRFGLAGQTGTIAPGLDADLTVVEGDPARDVRALGKVRATIRGGKVIHGATK